MADKKITQLTNITGANLAEADEFVVVDITADETKAITFSELKTAFDTGTGFVRITGDTMTGALNVESTITADGLTVDSGTASPIINLSRSGTYSGITFSQTISNTTGAGADLITYSSNNDTGYAWQTKDSGGTQAKALLIAPNRDISFYEDTGTTAKFFWDSSAERLGLGTSSPSSKLSITESTVGDLITVTGANGTDLRIGNHASANGGIYINSQAASDDLRFRTQGSDRMTITSAGSVGIGVSTPTGDGTALHIHGSSASTLHLTNSTTGSAISDGFDIVTDGLDALLRNRESGAIKFRIGSSEAMRIDSSGNVLVGKSSIALNTDGFEARAGSHVIATSSGGTPLLVNRKTSDGDITKFYKDGSAVGSIGTSNGNLIVSSSGTNKSGIYFGDNGLFPVKNGSLSTTTISFGSTNYRFKDLYLNGFTRYNAEVYVGDGASISGSYSANDLLLHTDNNPIVFRPNGSEAMRIASNGDILAKTIDARIGSDVGAVEYGTSTGNSVRFYSDDTERMRINSLGNVGIGESSPLGKLHVKNGDSGASADSGANELVIENNTHSGITILSGQSYNGSIYFGDSGVNYDGFVTYGQGTRSMAFGTAAGTRMTIDSSGNVGIGTSSPSRQLSLSHASQADISLLSGSDTNGGLIYHNASEQKLLIANRESDGHIAFQTGGTSERMRIDSSGNLLVGKTSLGISNAGHTLAADGYTEFTRTATSTSTGGTINVGRNSYDGPLATFWKDGSTVGSIGVIDGNNTFLQGATDHAGIAFGSSSVLPFRNSGYTSGTTDLGASNILYKDAYLSGGVYLGGTGSANKLEDYEEGTWTAGFSGTTATNISNTTGYYTKIGNTVHFSYYTSEVDFANSVTGGARITGLPFNASNSTQRYGLFLTSYGNGIGGESNGGFVSKNDNFLVFMVQESNSEATYNNGVNRRIMVAGTYMVD